MKRLLFDRIEAEGQQTSDPSGSVTPTKLSQPASQPLSIFRCPPGRLFQEAAGPAALHPYPGGPAQAAAHAGFSHRVWRRSAGEFWWGHRCGAQLPLLASAVKFGSAPPVRNPGNQRHGVGSWPLSTSCEASLRRQRSQASPPSHVHAFMTFFTFAGGAHHAAGHWEDAARRGADQAGAAAWVPCGSAALVAVALRDVLPCTGGTGVCWSVLLGSNIPSIRLPFISCRWCPP